MYRLFANFYQRLKCMDFFPWLDKINQIQEELMKSIYCRSWQMFHGNLEAKYDELG